jgi:hypothetical protein
MDLLLIGTITVLFLCILGLSWFAGSDAPYVPTKMAKVIPVLKKAGVKKGMIFYELGSGDGRLVLEAAKLGAVANGVEQSWVRVWYSRYQAQKEKLKDASFFHGDIFARNYYPADVVYIFMLPKAVDRLETKLKKELKKGAVVITQTFHFKKWKPYQKIYIEEKNKKPIFLGKDKKAGDFWFYRV